MAVPDGYDGSVMKLCIGFPWDGPFTWTRSMESMLQLQYPKDFDYFWVRGKGWCNAHRRNRICKEAIDGGATHILMLDADQEYPEDTVLKIIRAWRDGHEIIHIPVPANAGHEDQFKRLGFNFVKNQWQKLDLDKSDETEVDTCGSSVLFFKTEFLDLLPRPWHSSIIDQDLNDPMYAKLPADDTYFISKLVSMSGCKVHVLKDVDVKHCIPMLVGIEESRQLRNCVETQTRV